MQRLCIAALIITIGLPVPVLQAKSLVVLKSGETLPAREVKQGADQITYTPESGGSARTIKQDKIHAVLPMPERGKTYTPDQVDAIVTQEVALLRRQVATADRDRGRSEPPLFGC